MPDPAYEFERLNAEIRFVKELLGGFYANQVDAGAVLREEVAAHITAAAERAVAGAHVPAGVADEVRMSAQAMIIGLPEGWASGDDWQEPARPHAAISRAAGFTEHQRLPHAAARAAVTRAWHWSHQVIASWAGMTSRSGLYAPFPRRFEGIARATGSSTGIPESSASVAAR